MKHGQSDNSYLDFITDDIIDGFSVLGAPKEHVAKLEELQAAGITQFNIYLDNGDRESESSPNTASRSFPASGSGPVRLSA